MDIDFSNISKTDFELKGFYRAIVEDDDDPANCGRVRVRILGIHSLDGDETPVNHLPWAEPCLSIYRSGGFNLLNSNTDTPVTRYDSGADGPDPSPQDIPSREEVADKVVPEWQDSLLQNCGTGGVFVTPSKGTMVWIFFDGGDHLRPQYFMAAPRKIDWETQFNKLQADILDKDETLNNINSQIESSLGDNQEDEGKRQITQNIQIKTKIDPPSFDFDSESFNSSNVKNKDLTSWTSPGGVTFLAINDNNNSSNEKIYIMHKGYVEYVDENGQRSVLVGKTNTNSTDPLSPQHSEGLANDFKEITANNHELYVMGDYKVFIMNNCFVQCEKSVQINAKDEVGLYTREGNINILANSSDVNIESKSSNFNVSSIHSQFQLDGKFLVKSSEAIKFESEESIEFSAPLIKLSATDEFTLDSESIKIAGGESSILEINANGFFLESSGEIGFNSSDIITNATQDFVIKSNNINTESNNFNNEVKSDFNLKSTNSKFDSTVFSSNANSQIVMNSPNSSYGGQNCFVGGSNTQVGGTVSLGSGSPASPQNVTPPSIKPPTVPVSPEPVQELIFENSKGAKEITPKDTNF